MERSRVKQLSLAVLLGICYGSFIARDSLIFSIENLIDNKRIEELDKRSQTETFNEAIKLKNPEILGGELDNLPLNTIRNSVKITINYKNGNNSKWAAGSGLQVFDSSEYKVFLTAKHLFKTSETNMPTDMTSISFDQPQFDQKNILSSNIHDTWFFGDEIKDIGIIVVRNKTGLKEKDIRYQIDNTLSPTMGDGALYGISFPASIDNSGINFMPIKVPKGEINHNTNFTVLHAVTGKGASGSVLCDSEGNLVSVLDQIGEDNKGIEIVTTNIEDSLYGLLLKATGELNYPFV